MVGRADLKGRDVVGLLDGKVAVVTGGGSGIGWSDALTLATQGIAVVVNDLGPSAHEVVAEIATAGGQAVANSGDVTEGTTTQDLVDQAVKEFGSLDIVITNGGIVRRGAIVDVTEADLDAHISVLFKGTYSLLHHAGVYWRHEYGAGDRKRRAIVTTSSNGGIPGSVPEFLIYSGMKAAIATGTLDAALEHFASEWAAWLTGQIYEITGTNVRRWLPWSPALEVESDAQWTPDNLDDPLAQSGYGTLPSSRVVQKKVSPR
jgi:NAD(P)-dependent dehydrogenase (short-subunit alcohol dehydrogenase family)